MQMRAGKPSCASMGSACCGWTPGLRCGTWVLRGPRSRRTLTVGMQQLLPYTDLYKQAEPGFFAAISYARFRLHCVPRAAQTQVRRP